MWVPRQLLEQSDQLKKLGLAIDPAALADPMAYPLGAVVSLGGCSASFVSPDGLIVTNHHCATGALQYSSTPKENLLEKGYLAKTRSDEKWNGPSARVFVTQAFTDVTERVRKGLEAIKTDEARYDAIEKREKELIAECEKKPNVRCEVAEMFGGGQFLLIERLEIRDVRLVYAPPSGVGNFGGEIDNWRWPRHAGDFSFLRAYVGKDGKPADHAADNVPFKPRMHLKLATSPLSAGDLVFVAGYPGRTYRLYTAEETKEAVEWHYPKRIALFEQYLAMLEALGKDDPDVKIKATPLSRGLSNALTYTKGALEGLTKGGALAEREKRDQELEQWIEGETGRKQHYGKVFSDLERVFEERRRTRDADFALWELVRLSGLADAATTIARMASERKKPDAERDPSYQERNWKNLEQAQEALDKRYSAKLEAGLISLALERATKLSDAKMRDQILGAFVEKKNPTQEDIDKAVQGALAKTKLSDAKARVKLLKTATPAQIKASRDPLLQAAAKLTPLLLDMDKREHARDGALALVRPLYVAALKEKTPGPLAPDANGTLRVTYGTVRGYKPTPSAKTYEPFTRVEGIVKKATGKDPFDAPEKLLTLVKEKKFGPYTDPALGSVPVDFLADLDITGGNSGSPTLNARGELVGLAFDGNYEAMASDWLFMPDITRSIHVDLRYVLWVMDAVGGADALLQEMGVKPAIP